MTGFLVLLLVGQGSVAATVAPRTGGNSVTGKKDCSGQGRVSVTAHFSNGGGVNVNVKQSGPPATAKRWARTKDPAAQPNEFDDVSWTFVSTLREGTWGASKIKDVGGVLLASAQCSQRALPAGKPVASKAGGSKDCPVGQKVVISTDGWGSQWYTWVVKKGGARHHAKIFSQSSTSISFSSGYLYTGANSIHSWRVSVYKGSGPEAENWIPSWDIGCSAKYHVHS